jgi:hypothetical protein
VGDERKAPAQVASFEAFGDGLHDARLGQPLLADGAQDRLFGAEDGVNSPLGHSGLRGHDLDAGGRIAALGEQRSCRMRDREARLERLALPKRNARRLDFRHDTHYSSTTLNAVILY